MRLAYVDLCGFRGYRDRLRLEFADGFTIIDGRNGVGKSTIFDAVEFALTGDLGKYGGATADRESVHDYLWWRGEGAPPVDRYVEVGFKNGGDEICVRRTEFGGASPDIIALLVAKLCDPKSSPKDPLAGLCARSIIRDEQIAGLSLDLKEVERYSLLRDGLGVNDADDWIARAKNLTGLAKRRVESAQEEVMRINAELAQATKRLDEHRLSAVLISAEVQPSRVPCDASS